MAHAERLKAFVVAVEVMEMLWVLQDFICCASLCIRAKGISKTNIHAYIEGKKSLPHRGKANIVVDFKANVKAGDMYDCNNTCTVLLYHRILDCLANPGAIRFGSEYFSSGEKESNALKWQSQLRLLSIVCKNYKFHLEQANEIFCLYKDNYLF